jgi:MoxR-like ATPase
VEIVRRTTLRVPPQLTPVATLDDIRAVQRLVLAAPVSDHVIDYAVRLAAATRPANEKAPAVTKEFVEWGAGPRASQFLVLGAKALALLNGKVVAETAEIREVAASVLQHRVIVNYRATGAGRKSQHVVAELLKTVQEKSY